MKAVLRRAVLIAVCGLMCGCVDIKLSAEQEEELNGSLSKAGLHAKFHSGGIGGISLDDPVQFELSGQSLDQIVAVVMEFRDRNHLTSIRSVSVQGPESYVSVDLPSSPAPLASAGAPAPPAAVSWQHYSYPPISFDCPSYLAVPDKRKFDLEKVRDTLRPSGVEIVAILMSTDMNTTVQLARTKRNISWSSLYEEKKSLADEINKGGRNVMGEQYTKLIVERSHLSADTEALSGHGEKANGEMAEWVEFLSEGYDYSMTFIYKNRDLARSDSTIREKIVHSISVTSIRR